MSVCEKAIGEATFGCSLGWRGVEGHEGQAVEEQWEEDEVGF